MWMSKQAQAVVEARHNAEVARLMAAITAQQTELATQRTQILMLERALATAQSNVDWMRVFANSMSQDRQQLAAAKGLDLPGPEFSGTLQTPADIAQRAREREAAGGAPAIVGQEIAEAENVEAAMARYTGHVNGFEDVGDEVAEAQGIRHNAEDGTVEYSK